MEQDDIKKLQQELENLKNIPSPSRKNKARIHLLEYQVKFQGKAIRSSLGTVPVITEKAVDIKSFLHKQLVTMGWQQIPPKSIVTTDNTTTNESACGMTKSRRFPCLAHVLNLVMKAVYDVKEYSAFPGQISLLSSVIQAQWKKLLDKFTNYCQWKGKTIPNVTVAPTVCETRWNTSGRFAAWFLINQDWCTRELKAVFQENDGKKIEGVIELLNDQKFKLILLVEAFQVTFYADPILELLHHNQGRGAVELFSVLDKMGDLTSEEAADETIHLLQQWKKSFLNGPL